MSSFRLFQRSNRQFEVFLRFSPSQISGISSKVAVLALPVVCQTTRPPIHSRVPAGPLTPAVGDLVTPRVYYRSYALEGFSEDLQQDGFVPPGPPVLQDNFLYFKICSAAVPVVFYAVPLPLPSLQSSPVHCSRCGTSLVQHENKGTNWLDTGYWLV